MENIIFIKAIPSNKSRQQFIVLPNSIEAELISGPGNDKEGNPHLCVFLSIISGGKTLYKDGLFVSDSMKERFEKNREHIMNETRSYFDYLLARALSKNLTSNNEGAVTVLYDGDLESIRINLADFIYDYIDQNYKEEPTEPQSTAVPSSKASNTQKKKK